MLLRLLGVAWTRTHNPAEVYGLASDAALSILSVCRLVSATRVAYEAHTTLIGPPISLVSQRDSTRLSCNKSFGFPQYAEVSLAWLICQSLVQATRDRERDLMHMPVPGPGDIADASIT